MISRYYRLLSVVALLAGVFVAFFLVDGPWMTRLWMGLKLNLEIHVFFQLLSRLPVFAMRRITRRYPQSHADQARGVLTVLMFLFMAFSVFGLVDDLAGALKAKDSVALTFVLTNGGIFLGAASGWLGVRQAGR